MHTWGRIAKFLSLSAITEVDDWLYYVGCTIQGAHMKREHVEALTAAGEGIPGLVSALIQTAAARLNPVRLA
jgi:hypothetical protein